MTFSCRFALESDRGWRRWYCACGRRGFWHGPRSDVHGAWRYHQRRAWLSRNVTW
jgi:hypothetical protein